MTPEPGHDDLPCGEVLARLSDFLDGALTPDERTRVAAHVERCANCDEFGAAFATAVRALVKLREPHG